jgi:4-hydroxy-tetrahydrodipicolinate reductase
VRLIEQADDLELVASLNSRSSLEEMLGANVLVDMTLPAVSPEVVAFAIDHGLKVLVGTSGWSADRILDLERRVAEHEGSGAVVIPNFSLGSVLGTAFATVAARFFDSIEIIEAHGEGKVDSPSGTAVRTAELIGAARAQRGPVDAPHTDQRARGQQVASVPIHSMRMRGVAAQQQVVFGGAGETLTIRHDTVGSQSYEAGILLALRAAATSTGVIVGLDSLIDLGIAEPDGQPPRPTVRENA